MSPMAADAFITCRVTSETKALVRALANRQGLTESALVKELLGVALGDAASKVLPAALPEKVNRNARLYVRLEPEDWSLLKERAGARHLPSATYVSLLVRSHVRGATPLPRAEYLALKESLQKLAALGQTLAEIRRAITEGSKSALPGRADVSAMRKLAVALRDHVKALLNANERSWRGQAEDPPAGSSAGRGPDRPVPFRVIESAQRE